MSVQPVRLQLSRQRGADLQGMSQMLNGLGAVKVARRSVFGNMFKVGEDGDAARCVARFRGALRAAEIKSLGTRPDAARILKNLHRLKGKNLACWCKPDSPCHADVLLELANR
jgi:hypothetical protein